MAADDRFETSTHFVTSSQVRALAEGTSTCADLAGLIAGEASKCLAMLALIVRDAEAEHHQEADAAAAGWRLLTQVRREAPGAVTELLRYPSTGAWASRLTARGDASPGRLALIALAAAIRGGVHCSITLPPSVITDGRAHLPSLGTVLLPPGTRQVTVKHGPSGTEAWAAQAGGQVRITLPRRRQRDGPGWQALPTLAGPSGTGADRLLLVIDDADPYLFPSLVNPAGRLTPALRTDWRRRIAGGWRLLSRDQPRTAAEITRLIRVVVPLAADPGDPRSLTSRQTFGSVGLTLPNDDVQMALTLAHEVQHAKLSALMDLVPLVVTEPAPGGYYAPWRTDPRPLASLLQGMYAHLEVARFWRHRRQVVSRADDVWQANVEFAKWRAACVQVADSVRSSPGLTDCGTTFVGGMITVLRTWQNDSIPVAATAQADREINDHKRKWDARERADHEAASAQAGGAAEIVRMPRG